MTTNAIAAKTATGSVGVNTHIDFANFGYQNLTGVTAAINYLGVKELRDCPNRDSDIKNWGDISAATGARWLLFLGETSPTNAVVQLARAPAMVAAGVPLSGIEGLNEPDDPYSATQGMSISIAVAFQRNQVLPLGRSLNLPVVNISFGSGWTSANNWQGDYDKVGDMSDAADYANPHTYPQPGQTTEAVIIRLNELAHIACRDKPVMMTEIGWPDGQFPNERDEARFLLFSVFDALKLGVVRSYFYALYNDGSGKFGLMNTDGSPQQSGAALHNLMAILADTAAGTPGSLDFALSGVGVNDRSLLIQKSTGEFELVIWNERDVGHNVTVTLPQAAAAINVYDPLVGPVAVSTSAGAASVVVTITDHPLIVEIVPAVFVPPPPPPPPLLVQTPLSVSIVPPSLTLDDMTLTGTPVAKATALTSDGLPFTGAYSIAAPFAIDASGQIFVNGPLPTGPATLGEVVTAAGNGVTVTGALPTNITHAAPPPPPPPPPTTLVWDPEWVAPAALTSHAGFTMGSLSISITDPPAVGHAGTLALNIHVTRGTVAAKDAAGSFLPGSGTVKLATYKGSFAQINAVLATLTYKAATIGSDVLALDIWDQGGHEAKKNVAVTTVV